MPEPGPSSMSVHQEKASQRLPPGNANFEDIPDYWNAPGLSPNVEHSANSPISLKYYQGKGGMHISWLHYLSLCAIIFILTIIIAIWTTVALHRADSFSSMGIFQPSGNVINFNPYIVIGGLLANPKTAPDPNLPLTVWAITTVTSMVAPKTTEAISGALGDGSGDKVSSSSINMASEIKVMNNETSSSTFFVAGSSKLSSNLQHGETSKIPSSSTIDPPTASQQTTTLTTTSILTPTEPIISPSTKYFQPPVAEETEHPGRANKFEALGGGVQ